MVDVDKIVANIRNKLEKMTKEEQLEYLKSVGFVFNNKQSSKDELSKKTESDDAPQM